MNGIGMLAARLWLLGAAVFVAGLWLLYALTANDPVLGESVAHNAINAVAIVASAALAVALAGGAVLGFAPGIWGPSPTGFQRVIVYGLLTCAAVFMTLHHFGHQLGAILTTSAIATAAIALALQPTLGSMIAGMAIHTDRILHVGDGVMQDGEPVRILSMNWRMVVGRRADGRIVIIPNAKLSDTIIDVLPHDAALRKETVFAAALAQSPQQICDLVREMVAEFAAVDNSQPIMVAPLDLAAKDNAKFHIRYWVRPWWDAATVEGEIARRLWYLFQRHGIVAAPGFDAENPAQGYRGEILRILADAPAEAAALADRVTADSRLLLFAPDERLIMPQWSAGHRFLLLRGDAVAVRNFDLVSDFETGGAPLWVQKPGHIAATRRVCETLTGIIGPYAEFAVRRAAESAGNFEALCRAVALEIDDTAKRQIFLQTVLPDQETPVPLGHLLETHHDASGNLVCRFGLRAASEVAILALPPPAAFDGKDLSLSDKKPQTRRRPAG